MRKCSRQSFLSLTRLETRAVPSGTQLFAIGEDSATSRVAVYSAPVDHLIHDPTGSTADYFQRESKLLATFIPYVGFRGGVRIAIGDVSGDGIDDVVTVPGYGGGPHIKVFDGAGLQNGAVTLIHEFFAFDSGFRGGVFVATGQMDPASPHHEIVVGAGESGGPHVRIFAVDPIFFIQAPPNPTDYYTSRMINEFFAFDGGFRGGVRVAAGDVNGDGRDDLIAAAGPGGGPHVKVFDVFPPNPLALYVSNRLLIDEFFAYDANFRGGVYVAAGNLTGDVAHAEVVTGPGEGGGPHVKVFARNNNSKLALNSEVFLGAPESKTGARIGLVDIGTDPNVDSLIHPMPTVYVGFAAAPAGPVILAETPSNSSLPFGEYRIAGLNYESGRFAGTFFGLPFGLGGDVTQGLYVGV